MLLTPPKLQQWRPPNIHRLWRTVWKVSSTGQRSPSYRCSGVFSSTFVFSFIVGQVAGCLATIWWLPWFVTLLKDLKTSEARKYSLHVLFSKLNAVPGHSSAFLGLQMLRQKQSALCSKQLPLKSEHTLPEPSLKCHRRWTGAEKPALASMLYSWYTSNMCFGTCSLVPRPTIRVQLETIYKAALTVRHVVKGIESQVGG